MLSARPFALDGDFYHAKTPARATRDRNLLQENLHRVPMTVNGKGKALQTPRRAMAVQSHKALSHSVKPTIRVQKPLGDKTPFPNRVANTVPFDAPAPQTAKLAKLALLEAPQEVLPEALLRPSSARKSLRAPRMSGSIQLDFKTPVTRGDHWNVSDGEIDVDLNEEAEEVADVRGEDDDEIEYMPQTAIAPVYEPPFEMPDYTQLGAAIRGLAHSYKLDDADDMYYSHDAHIDVESRDLWRASGFAPLDSPSRWDTPELAPLGESASLTLRAHTNPRCRERTPHT
ncbi:hypothetical protein FOMPIDRAFT_1136962 [Fomitopsis schrenkii]|uniref:Uncharacterized protein n=1 Tax=Fomitopsis schrenkii TaxID=2126942 RepID=S8F1Y8_FOMSC|nr:hypothetical protein FOMPIDRAFT_1136962 [Fomitopsis schrenkii]